MKIEEAKLQPKLNYDKKEPESCKKPEKESKLHKVPKLTIMNLKGYKPIGSDSQISSNLVSTMQPSRW